MEKMFVKTEGKASSVDIKLLRLKLWYLMYILTSALLIIYMD